MRIGTVAKCGKGAIGLITEEKPKQLPWGEAYVGIHLTDKIAPIGSPWASRKPQVIGHITEFEDLKFRMEGLEK